MLNKAIEDESKATLQLSTSICEMDTYCWKGYKPNKKKEIFKFLKKEPKAKLFESQPTLLGISN